MCNLSSLDVSTCTALETLKVNDAALSSLTLPTDAALTTINLKAAGTLSALDLSGCPLLENLDVYGLSPLTALDLSNNMALQTLDCRVTGITSLDLSDHTALTTLSCQGTSASSRGNLQTLDISGCTALETLSVQYNRLTSLDITGCTALTSVYCQGNQFTSLDFSGNTTLTTLSCGSDYLLTSLNLAGCTALKTLTCSSSSLGSLDVTGCTALRFISCEMNKFTKDEVTAFFSTLPTIPLSTNYIRYYYPAYTGAEHNYENAYVFKKSIKKGWKVQYATPSSSGWWNYRLAPDLKGDVNDDGVRDTTDVHLLADILVGKEEYVPMADMSGDSIASLADITLLNNYLLYGNSGVDENGHRYVDLGLPSGTLWAACNVGGSSEEDTGTHLPWGHTEAVAVSSWAYYKWCEWFLGGEHKI